MAENKIKLFLDSGAYTAWTRKLDLPIKPYINFCKRHKDHLFAYVNMDVIPGVFPKKRTAEDYKVSSQKSYENMQRMLDADLRPIPVVHQGEDLNWVNRYIEEGIDYIGISMSKDSFARHKEWLNQIFSIVCDKQGRPRVKVHGFGITTPSVLLHYPFYTVDSTTWLLSPAYGQVIVPAFKLDGSMDFSLNPSHLMVSSVDHTTIGHNDNSYDVVGRERERVVNNYIRDVLKTTIEDLRYDTHIRRRSVVAYYEEMAKAISPVRFTRFYPRYAVPNGGPGTDRTLIVIYVLSWQPAMCNILNSQGANHHLLSYVEVKDRPDKHLIHYIENGEMLTKPVSKRRPSWTDRSYLSSRALALHRRKNGTLGAI